MTDRNRSISTVRTWFRAGAAAAVAGVLLAGCSSGDDAASGSSTTAPTTNRADTANLALSAPVETVSTCEEVVMTSFPGPQPATELPAGSPTKQ
jgi:hypothetical protein